MDINCENNSLGKPKLYPIKKAAKQLNLQYRQLLSAVNEGLVPSYQLRNSRKLVNPSEIIQLMKNNGGSDAQ